jgi:hypothetical protein
MTLSTTPQLTPFQEQCRARVESVLLRLELDGRFDLTIGASEDYLVGTVKLTQVSFEIFIYEDEAGLKTGPKQWRLFEKWDYANPDDLIEAFCHYLETMIVKYK